MQSPHRIPPRVNLSTEKEDIEDTSQISTTRLQRGFSHARDSFDCAAFCFSGLCSGDSTVNPLAAAGCGANEIHFDVKTDKKEHPTTQPHSGKALVYVIGAAWSDYVAVHVGTPPTRFGIDDTWVGANGYRSYFFFTVEPGDHRLCTSFQSKFKRVVKSSTAATSFTAEAGKTYYFRTKTPRGQNSYRAVKLVPVDPAEAQKLIAAAAFGTFRPKK
jgi:hypothetical protein